ncbi:hypothetical protein NP569_24535, partial [Vibrio parahaemolyticus]|nr:hypothetical protein [Vibrio parahaemolyticus]
RPCDSRVAGQRPRASRARAVTQAAETGGALVLQSGSGPNRHAARARCAARSHTRRAGLESLILTALVRQLHPAEQRLKSWLTSQDVIRPAGP